MGIAILRHDLYDIDIIINRSLVYGLLTAALGALYAAGIVGFGSLLDPLTGGSDLAVAASTLTVAGVFRPLRTHTQHLVDRRYYRHKYDAAAIVDRFSARLRDEIDLDTLTGELHAVVQETMQPAHVSFWLRPVGSAHLTTPEPDG
jgi:hypothetical protein